jgi:hypothetical protein
MKLQDLAATKPTKQIAKVFESYFGSKISVDQLNRHQTVHMLQRVRSILGEHRQTTARHTSQNNPNYLKLVMMEQALVARLAEEVPMPGTATTGTATAGAAGSAQAGIVASNLAAQKDPKVKAALTKASKGQTLTPDEQKIVAGAALMHTESKLRRAYQMLKESEVQQAQVVLAAQDMVDKMQGMLEDVSELQFKELPALVDSIKNQVGIDQATQFNTDVSGALTTLMQSLQQTKQQLDQALGVVTGQTPPPDAGMASMGGAPGADMGAAGADMAAAGADMGAAAGDELDAAAAAAGEEEVPPVGKALGRARR